MEKEVSLFDAGQSMLPFIIGGIWHIEKKMPQKAKVN